MQTYPNRNPSKQNKRDQADRKFNVGFRDTLRTKERIEN